MYWRVGAKNLVFIVVLGVYQQMAIGYEVDARKDRRRVEEARKEAVVLKSKLTEAETKHAAKLASVLTQATSRAHSLEDAMARESAVLSSLKRRINENNALQEANVKKAQKAAKWDLTEKFQGRLAKAEKKIEALKKAKERELDLAQIDSNLQLIAILQKDNAPTLESEVAKLSEWRVDMEGADDEFEGIAIGLRDCLRLSPVSSDSMGSLLGNESLENVAATVSVEDFSGSNAGTPVVAMLAAEKAAEANLP